jgi:hypothetical protein
MSEPARIALPNWWSDDLLPSRLLHRFLDQLEAGRRPYLKVTPKTTPELYDFQGQDVDFLWALLESLDKDHHLITIKLARTRAPQEPYDNAKIYFIAAQEPVVRTWLKRPAFDPYALGWRHELARQSQHFADNGAALQQRHIRVKGLSAVQVVQAFARIGTELQQPQSLRTLAARCFAGDSKCLDQQEPLLRLLFPHLMHNLQARPLMLTVHLAEATTALVFVENQDTFLQLAQADLPGLSLVYSAGFRASATRVREPQQVSFAYLNPERDGRAFTRLWFDCPNDTLPAYFWGDLDYAGMSILKALRISFTRLTAWQPGYAPLLARLNEGLGHTQASGVKSHQPDPVATGCPYADTVLLPAIRHAQSYVDQEAVLVSELCF